MSSPDLGTSSPDSDAIDLATFVQASRSPSIANLSHHYASPPLPFTSPPITLTSPSANPSPGHHHPPRGLSISGFEALLTPPSNQGDPSSPTLSSTLTLTPPSHPFEYSPTSTSTEKGKQRRESHHRAGDPPPIHQRFSSRERIDALNFGQFAVGEAQGPGSSNAWERRRESTRAAASSRAHAHDYEGDKLARIQALDGQAGLSGGRLGEIEEISSGRRRDDSSRLGLRRRSSVAVTTGTAKTSRQRAAVATGTGQGEHMRRNEAQIVQMMNEKWEEREEEEMLDEEVLERRTMDLAQVRFVGWWPRLLHILFPFYVVFHYPATLFLDYNVLYIVTQIALFPSLPSTTASLNSSDFNFFQTMERPSVVARDALPIPTLHLASAYWIALGLYGLCTLLWGTVVSLWWEIGHGYLNLWGVGGQRRIKSVYAKSTTFNFACMTSYEDFSFLFRIRLAPFQKYSPLCVSGSKKRDGILETCQWYAQNWPTVLLLIPRAGISIAVLLLYGTTAYGTPSVAMSTMGRDPGYFIQGSGVLSNWALILLLVNLIWAAYRLVLILIAAFGLLVLNSDSRTLEPRNPTSPEHPEHSPETQYTGETGRSRRLVISNFRTRRARRIAAAVELCTFPEPSPRLSFGPTPRTQAHSIFESPIIRNTLSVTTKEAARRAKLAKRGEDWRELDLDPSPRLIDHSGRELTGEEEEDSPRHSRREFPKQKVSLPPPPPPIPITRVTNAVVSHDDAAKPWLKSAFSSAATLPLSRTPTLEIKRRPLGGAAAASLEDLDADSPTIGGLHPTPGLRRPSAVPSRQRTRTPSPTIISEPTFPTTPPQSDSPRLFYSARDSTPRPSSPPRRRFIEPALPSPTTALPPPPFRLQPTESVEMEKQSTTQSGKSSLNTDRADPFEHRHALSMRLSMQAAAIAQSQMIPKSPRLLDAVQMTGATDATAAEQQRSLAQLTRAPSNATSTAASRSTQHLSLASEMTDDTVRPDDRLMQPVAGTSSGDGFLLPPFRLSIVSHRTSSASHAFQYGDYMDEPLHPPSNPNEDEDDEEDMDSEVDADADADVDDAEIWSSPVSRTSASPGGPVTPDSTDKSVKKTRRGVTVRQSPGDTLGGTPGAATLSPQVAQRSVSPLRVSPRRSAMNLDE